MSAVSNWPETPRTFMTGRSRGIGQHDRHLQETCGKVADIAPCSAKLSAQSPPCSGEESFAFLRLCASCFFRLCPSPANTSGGKVASCFSTSSNACGPDNPEPANWLLGANYPASIAQPSRHSRIGRPYTRPWPREATFLADLVIFGLTRPPRGHSSYALAHRHKLLCARR